MDKKQIAGVVVVIVSLLFITEQFYFGQGTTRSNPITPGTNVSGTTVFNGTIRTYDPLLVVGVNTSQADLDMIKSIDAVKGVRTNPQGYIIDVETRDDVYPIALKLREKNITAYAVANIALTDTVKVDTPQGLVNASAIGGVVRVITEPLLDVDSPVTVSMIAVVNNGILIDYRSAEILLQSLDLQLDAIVERLDAKVYSYSIPWQNRTDVGNLSDLGEVDYKGIDSIVFKTPLNTSQILVKKKFPYISYIDASSAQVSPGFNNISLIAENFADTPFTLPPSRLTITTNKTLSLPFNGTVLYNYVLALNQSSTRYIFPSGSFFIQSEKELRENSTIRMNVSAVGIGDRIISVKRVSLPS
ncbi:MAG: hypothetical protein U0R44_02075 [Candidatus Micrarchaeia archaeon]